MKFSLSSITAFALAGSAVTSTAAASQDHCLADLAKTWDRNASHLLSKKTAFGSTTAAFLVTHPEKPDARSVMTLSSNMSHALLYHDPALREKALSADDIDDVGLFKNFRPDAAHDMKLAAKDIAFKTGFDACIK